MDLQRVPLAVDAMGGDVGPGVVVPALLSFMAQNSSVKVHLFGHDSSISPFLRGVGDDILSRILIIHTPYIIESTLPPAAALRMKHKSSMHLAIESVVHGQTGAVVSAGNTGAYMVLCRRYLGMIHGIERPAIASFIPSQPFPALMLDLGANTTATAEQLIHFSLMGSECAARLLPHLSETASLPRVGLLNIGTEDAKGPSEIQDAAHFIKQNPHIIHYVGFIESSRVLMGDADVIVSNGFAGNLVLKAMEGTAEFIVQQMRSGFSSDVVTRFIGWLAHRHLRRLFDRFDHNLYNGALFLGLRHLAFKSHGGANVRGFCNALRMCYDLMGSDMAQQIENRLNALDPLTLSS